MYNNMYNFSQKKFGDTLKLSFDIFYVLKVAG